MDNTKLLDTWDVMTREERTAIAPNLCNHCGTDGMTPCESWCTGHVGYMPMPDELIEFHLWRLSLGLCR